MLRDVYNYLGKELNRLYNIEPKDSTVTVAIYDLEMLMRKVELAENNWEEQEKLQDEVYELECKVEELMCTVDELETELVYYKFDKNEPKGLFFDRDGGN